MNEFEITGRARSHVIDLSQCGRDGTPWAPCILHYEAAASFSAMRDAAARDGIALLAHSSFRDFATQVSIWNRKWRGERPLFDRQSQPLDHAVLIAGRDGEAALVDAILAWSAVPGGSRHHWGTDFDVIDVAAMPNEYKVQLVVEEYTGTGVFARLRAWLEANLADFGFFRPYRTDRGGVCPEPWHISYAPVAMPALELLGLSVLRRALQDSELQGKAQVLARLPEIYTRYLLAIDGPESVKLSARA
jgi:LAS superfamily LD-carboxypeptidase LdcB